MAKYEEKKKQKEQENHRLQKKASAMKSGTSYWLLAPLIAVFSFIPLVMHYYEYDPKLQGFNWFAGSDTQVDLSLHCKMVLLIICSIYILGMLLYLFKRNGNKLEFPKVMFPLALYVILVLISAVVSENSYFSFNGIFNQFEPVWALIGYCLIAYYAFLVVRSEEAVHKLMKWFIAGIVVMLVIGVFQGLGYNPFAVEVVQKLLGAKDGLQNTDKDGVAFMTLYNPNYAGVYMILVVPIIISVLVTVSKIWQKVLSGLLLVAGIYVLYASGSKAGLLTLGISIVLLMLFNRNIWNKKYIIGFLAVLAISFVGINTYYHNTLINHVKDAFVLREQEYNLEGIETKKDGVFITYKGEVLEICRQKDMAGNEYFFFTDGDGNEIEPVLDEVNNYYNLQDERFPFQFAKVVSDRFEGFYVVIDGYKWYFSNQMKEGDTTYYAYRTTHSLPMTLQKDTQSYNSFLNKYPMLFSGRGYIWSRTLPLLTKYFWIGSGPDTFMLAFPNDDLVQRVNRWYAYSYTTRPHSLYLQIAVQTGVPSLLCLLIFWGAYLIDSFRLYWKPKQDGYLVKIGICCMVSVIGFLIAGLTNDSMVVITPIFYAILGVGMGINHTLKKQVVKIDLGEKRERK